MKKMKITIDNIEPKHGSGNEGHYYKINDEVGVKIPGADYDRIRLEAKSLRLVNRRCPGIFPKFFGIVDVVVNGLPKRGLLLEHISGETMENLGLYEENDYGDYDFAEYQGDIDHLHEELRLKGLRWTDGHPGNIMADLKGNVRFIDVGSTCLNIIKKAI